MLLWCVYKFLYEIHGVLYYGRWSVDIFFVIVLVLIFGCWDCYWLVWLLKKLWKTYYAFKG